MIAGDGIGQEVVPQAIRCVDAIAERVGFTVTWRDHDWGSARYRRTGRMMPEDGLEQLSSGDGILLGAVGAPDIPDDVTLWGLLIPIRRGFDQYVNLRPVRALTGVTSPVTTGALNVVVVRENVEGEYSEVGGRFGVGTPAEAAVQEAVFTRYGVTRIARYAARLASDLHAPLVSATKSNGIIHSMPFWDEVVAAVAAEEGVVVDRVLIDALAARFVLRPESVRVVVASNLFGDILSDLAAAVAGSIGIAPSANLNPERRFPSLFEPVHGSAPDIAGRDVANPVATMWACALMLDDLGEHSAARRLEAGFCAVLAEGASTADLGGRAGTREFTDLVLDHL